MALKSANGRQTHHTKTGLPVCCEQALKGVGEQNTFGKPPAREKSANRNTSGGAQWPVALLDMEGGDLATGGLFTPCWRISDRNYRLASRVGSYA
jgi:hypothetical protein